jgi:hypothetical protein
MKKLIAAALLVALSGVGSMARAGIAETDSVAVREAPPARPVPPAPSGVAGEGADYARREANTPELGAFRGGGGGIYIGSGALIVILLVIIIVILV